MGSFDKTRRSLGQALQTTQLSPDAQAFLSPAPPPPNRRPTEAPTGVGGDHAGLVSMTFRIPADLPAPLLRAAVEQKVRRAKPATQQEIVADALRHWLKARGFLT